MGPQKDPVEKLDIGTQYPPAPVDTRKELVLRHGIFIDKTLIILFLAFFLIGFCLSIFHKNSMVKTFGSGMTGVALGALANRLKDTKLNPD
jgi:hypothetical protein